MICKCKETCFSYQHNVYEDEKIVRYKVFKCPRLSTDKKVKCDFFKRDKISENTIEEKIKKTEYIHQKEEIDYIKILKYNMYLYKNNKIENCYEHYSGIITWILAKFNYKPFVHGLETIDQLKIRILKSPDNIKNYNRPNYPICIINISELIKLIKLKPIKRDIKKVNNKYHIVHYNILKNHDDEDSECGEESEEDEGFDMENDETDEEADDYEVLSD